MILWSEVVSENFLSVFLNRLKFSGKTERNLEFSVVCVETEAGKRFGFRFSSGIVVKMGWLVFQQTKAHPPLPRSVWSSSDWINLQLVLNHTWIRVSCCTQTGSTSSFFSCCWEQTSKTSQKQTAAQSVPGRFHSVWLCQEDMESAGSGSSCGSFSCRTSTRSAACFPNDIHVDPDAFWVIYRWLQQIFPNLFPDMNISNEGRWMLVGFLAFISNFVFQHDSRFDESVWFSSIETTRIIQAVIWDFCCFLYYLKQFDDILELDWIWFLKIMTIKS